MKGFALLPLLCLPQVGPVREAGADVSPNDPVPSLLDAVSAERIKASIERLAGFRTRHTFSRTDSDVEGIGAARRWIEAELRACSDASGGRLDVRTQRFLQTFDDGGGEREAEIVNVYGFLPGRVGALGRTYLVTGHYDSIVSSSYVDPNAYAPGADDDASGTAVVLELARVLSRHEFEANLIFLCVAGEEQGLLGSKHFAEQAAAAGLQLDGVITNDIVGSILGGNGVKDDRTVRCFAGGEPGGSTREFGRSLAEAAARYVPDAEARLVFRRDRIGRGGDHLPFLDLGVPALRMTEANEDYTHQHQDVVEWNGVQRGDLVEFVSAEYTARVARVNAAILTQLALAPQAPTEVRLHGAMRHDAELSWQAVPGAAGYIVVWRETTASTWEHRSELVTGTRHELPGVTADNCFFGVRSVAAAGHESRTAVPARP